MAKERFIVHIDMDAFYAAIEQRDNPSLRDKPVIVGSDPKGGKGRGVVSTCSYEARKFGIHSAMPISIAYRKCPKAIFLPVDMGKYIAVSDEIFKILYEFSPDIEPVSVDEAFLDITGTYKIFGTPHKTCILIKKILKEKTGLTASVGMAPIKMVAKIASDLQKPDGLVQIPQNKLHTFLSPLDISKLWGVGEKTKITLNQIGINTIGDLARQDPKEWAKRKIQNGQYLWQLANGIDTREVETETDVKSISNEYTFSADTDNENKIEGVLMALCEKVSMRLREQNLKGKKVSLKIRLQDFQTFNRSKTIEKPTNFIDTIYTEIKRLYDAFDKQNKKVRLVGVKSSNFGFQDEIVKEPTEIKREKLHQALDEIKKKFGDDSVKRATTLR